MHAPWHVVTFYKFLPIGQEDVARLKEEWTKAGSDLGLCGLLLLAQEGVNATLAGTHENVATFLGTVERLTGPLDIKRSDATDKPFKRWKISVRDEIVAIGDPSMHPTTDRNNHVTPQEWNRMMDEEDVIVIDTRNTYETDIGTFRGAYDPRIRKFNEFPDAIRRANIPKDKKILMCCTGGIRCEKAILEMQKQGYEHVYQLQGGILQYLEESPDAHFEGECFVFDHRVAVDQKLQPSKTYGLCVFCGDPGSVRAPCDICHTTAFRCRSCAESHPSTCSKRCAADLAKKAPAM